MVIQLCGHILLCLVILLRKIPIVARGGPEPILCIAAAELIPPQVVPQQKGLHQLHREVALLTGVEQPEGLRCGGEEYMDLSKTGRYFPQLHPKVCTRIHLAVHDRVLGFIENVVADSPFPYLVLPVAIVPAVLGVA